METEAALDKHLSLVTLEGTRDYLFITQRALEGTCYFLFITAQREKLHLRNRFHAFLLGSLFHAAINDNQTN